MKTLEFKLDQRQVDLMFSAVRSKEDIIVLWMRAVKIALAYVEPRDEEVAGVMSLLIDKMSRLFFVGENKIFSVNLPFFVQDEGNGLMFSSHSCREVDNRVSSEVLALIANQGILSKQLIWDFADPIYESSEIDPSIWCVFRDLMLCEEGYIRFDHDNDRANGHIHPLNHLDVFYSSSTTFKLGLQNRLSGADLGDLLNINTDCHYVQRK